MLEKKLLNQILNIQDTHIFKCDYDMSLPLLLLLCINIPLVIAQNGFYLYNAGTVASGHCSPFQLSGRAGSLVRLQASGPVGWYLFCVIPVLRNSYFNVDDCKIAMLLSTAWGLFNFYVHVLYTCIRNKVHSI